MDIKLFWWRGVDFTNFGDEMNPDIVKFVSGKNVIKADTDNANLFAIGSVLHRTQDIKCRVLNQIKNNKCYVWGTGTLEPKDIKNENILDVSLVRGPLTASLLKSKPLFYGDPGLLVSEVWKVKRDIKYKWGLIVHHSQYNKDWINKFLTNDDVLFIDIKDPDINNIMIKINQCEFIASSSLHGLIVADSYKIPNYWLWDDELHRGGEWKFMDYFLSIKRDPYKKYNPSILKNLNEILEIDCFEYLNELDRYKEDIVNSFPKDLL